MFNKKPILKYESSLEEYPKSIVPAKSKVPDWYKAIDRWMDDKVVNEQNVIGNSVKQCMPFLDSLTSGYMITLPYDIYVKNHEGMPYLIWKDSNENHPKWRPTVAHPNLIPTGFAPMEYTWDLCVSFQVPFGYSMLVTHPLNRYDLPFLTLSGIIDGGYSVNPHGNFPFYMKQGFEGMIEQGTPVAQIIPFRQESWTANEIKGLNDKGKLAAKKSDLVFSGWYKKTFWTKKYYS